MALGGSRAKDNKNNIIKIERAVTSMNLKQSTRIALVIVKWE